MQVKDLEAGMTLEKQPLMIKSCEIKKTKNGKDYADLVLCDKTGQLIAKLWNHSEVLPSGVVMGVFGRITEYNGTLQMTIDRYCSIPEDTVKMEDYILTTPFQYDLLVKSFKVKLTLLKKRSLLFQRILDNLFTPDLENKFIVAPAAQKHHSNYRGGLLEHTIHVLNLALEMANQYGAPIEVNKDVLGISALIHDWGKLFEYDTDKSGAIEKTDLLANEGHISILRGRLSVIYSNFKLSELTDDLVADYRKICHCILAHHGNKKWGSPVNPQTIEAVILHMADLTDSRLINLYQDNNWGWE